MKPEMNAQIREAVEHFQYEGSLFDIKSYGSGHINDTYLLTFKLTDGGCIETILQKMNRAVFTNPKEVMENILGVTSHLHKKIMEAGGSPDRETLHFLLTAENKPYYIDSTGDYWRSYIYIADAVCYDKVEKPEHFYQSAIAFGRFQRLLADYPAETLHEVIKGFHDTKARFAVFKKAVAEDTAGRASHVQKEIQFVLEREDVADYFSDILEKKEIPIRVTHNDTKLNNILIDNETGKGICVIDLDTVMPGLSVYDFGDSIRYGASTAAEDEENLDKVALSLDLFEIYTKGYIEGCGGRLTEKETLLMPMGAKVMTYECGMRFLTDYLQGDTYFKIQKEHQNLYRCRTQFKLVEDMEKKWDTMQKIVEKYAL